MLKHNHSFPVSCKRSTLPSPWFLREKAEPFLKWQAVFHSKAWKQKLLCCANCFFDSTSKFGGVFLWEVQVFLLEMRVWDFIVVRNTHLREKHQIIVCVEPLGESSKGQKGQAQLREAGRWSGNVTRKSCWNEQYQTSFSDKSSWAKTLKAHKAISYLLQNL